MLVYGNEPKNRTRRDRSRTRRLKLNEKRRLARLFVFEGLYVFGLPKCDDGYATPGGAVVKLERATTSPFVAVPDGPVGIDNRE